MQLNALGVAHFALQEHVQPGAFCIDATAARAGTRRFWLPFVKKAGGLVALDIQHEP